MGLNDSELSRREKSMNNRVCLIAALFGVIGVAHATGPAAAADQVVEPDGGHEFNGLVAWIGLE
jgi:hypothetical protein